jgi:hypothetical protein
VTGIPCLANSASADSYADQLANNEVLLYTQFAPRVSVQSDGANATVHLLAGGGENVSQIQFQYLGLADVAPTNIGAPVSRSNGAFSAEWTPPAGLYNLNGTEIIAVPLTGAGTPIAGAEDSSTVRVAPNDTAVGITNAPGSAVGVFRQPYVTEGEDLDLGVVKGNTSDASPGATVSVHNLTTGSPTGDATANDTILEAAAGGVRAFAASVDFSGYAFDASAPVVNEAVVGAQSPETGTSTDDAELVDLYEQEVTTVTAVASPASIPTGGSSTGTVTVLDLLGNVVRGAQVVLDVDKNDVLGAGDTVAYTDSKGVASFPGLAGSNAPGTTYNVFVNTTDGDDYQPAVDFKRTFTITSADQVPGAVTATSADGNAFDVDEYAAGDLKVKVTDQNNAGVANQTVHYRLSLAPFPTTPATPVPAPATGSVVTGVDGSVNIPFTDLGNGTYTLATYVEKDGTPGQTAGDLAGANLVLKAGEAELVVEDDVDQVQAVGSTATYDATLELEDGTALPGRAVRFTFAPGGNEVVAAQANQPAGTTRVSDTVADDVTSASGVVSVALADPAAPSTAQLGGTLDAQSQGNAIGNAGANAGAIAVDFVSATPPANTTVLVSTLTTGTPGEAESGTVKLTSDDTDPATPPNPQNVAGQLVTLKVDQGFFTDGTPDPAPAAGANAGELKSLGQEITVATNASGVASFQVAIERNNGFDDDGKVKATVTATAGTFSDTEDLDWSSANPINGGGVFIAPAPAAEQANPVDPTRVGQDIAYDVVVTDQFGNPVEGESVDVSYDSTDVSGDTSAVSDLLRDGDFEFTSSEAETVEATVEWDTSTVTYSNATPPVATGGTETLEASDTTEFYEVNFAQSVFTIKSSPEGRVPVGTAVTETVKVVDQKGRPVSGLQVQFIRSGPADQTGDPNTTVFTNVNGEAFYSFTGTREGVAQISAVVSDGVSLKTLSDAVPFGAAKVVATISGASKGAKDVIKVKTAPAAKGAVAKLFKVVNGKKVLAGTKTLKANGRTSFSKADTNGRRFTKYFVKVSKTNTTNGDRSNTISIR